jgi:hypothetical protein
LVSRQVVEAQILRIDHLRECGRDCTDAGEHLVGLQSFLEGRWRLFQELTRS